MKRVAILGSTGSVGENALRIVDEHPDRFDVVALSAHRSAAPLVAQAARHRPAAVALAAGGSTPPDLPGDVAWHPGADGILAALDAADPDVVLNAITGAAGLPASEWTLRHGKTLALANKESLVMAGAFLMELARATGAEILPVDSEHCALHQCLRGEDRATLRRIHLTASGGPFRQRPIDTFDAITVDEALRHPTWDMGRRITIGSATMMNKAFEIVEARWLFDLRPEEIEVVVHPQSIVHSMVEFVDGSMMAQLGLPDMRVPILYCLAHPERLPFEFEPFDVTRWARLEFEAVDPARYPAVELAFEAIRAGGDAGAVLNAADEVMTGLFLDGRVGFRDIARVVAEVLEARPARPVHGLDDVLAADREARILARERAGVPAGPEAG